MYIAMCPTEAINASPNPTNKVKFPRAVLHPLAVAIILLPLSYFFTSHAPIQSIHVLGMAIVLWVMAWQDYKTQDIDLRWLGIFFLIVLLAAPHPALTVYLTLVGFFIPHLIHEVTASVEPASRKGQGSFQFQGVTRPEEVGAAPPYLPLFLFILLLLLTYYMLALPMPDDVYFVVFAAIPEGFFPLWFWALPLVLGLLSLGFYFRNHRAMKQGKNIVYKGFGDGDIYFFGVMVGAFGFFLTLLTVFLSMFPAFFILRRYRALQEAKQEATT